MPNFDRRGDAAADAAVDLTLIDEGTFAGFVAELRAEMAQRRALAAAAPPPRDEPPSTVPFVRAAPGRRQVRLTTDRPDG